MSERAISVRDLAFVRDVLIPRCAWVEGPEVEAIVGLRLRIDEVMTTFARERPVSPTSAAPAETTAQDEESPASEGEPC